MNRVSTKVRVPDLAVMKERGERIVMLTAYDATMARLLDRAGIDVLMLPGTMPTTRAKVCIRNPRPRGGMALPHSLKNDCARCRPGKAPNLAIRC